MEIVLIRHAEPEWVREGLSIDFPPLTDRGFEQADLLADALSLERFDEILVSPLLRARQTAAPLLRRLAREEKIDDWLEEIRNPLWQGSPAEKAEVAFQSARARPSHDQWHGLPGGESMRDFVDRIHVGVTGFLEARGVRRSNSEMPVWEIDEPGRRIALVAHAGTNAVTISHLLGLAPVPWEWDRFVLGHASVSRMEALAIGDGYTFSLSRLSDVEHLPLGRRTR